MGGCNEFFEDRTHSPDPRWRVRRDFNLSNKMYSPLNLSQRFQSAIRNPDVVHFMNMFQRQVLRPWGNTRRRHKSYGMIRMGLQRNTVTLSLRLPDDRDGR